MITPGATNGLYPRELRGVEKDLLDSVLPADRHGYRAYRDVLAPMKVLAQGARGTGHLILGLPGERVDLSSPLTPVIAYGAFEKNGASIAIAVHEQADDQVQLEIVATPEDAWNGSFDGARRWTYSTWEPGRPSPRSGDPVREVSLVAGHTLALCPVDRRMWLHDSSSGMNRLIPITTFYGELMAVEKIRDPGIAFHPAQLFEKLEVYSDEHLKSAFLAYNGIHPRISEGWRMVEKTKRDVRVRVLGFLRNLSRHA